MEENNATCNDSGNKVLIQKVQITAQTEPEKRIVSSSTGWTCSNSKNCNNLNCLGHGKSGKLKNWKNISKT